MTPGSILLVFFFLHWNAVQVQGQGLPLSPFRCGNCLQKHKFSWQWNWPSWEGEIVWGKGKLFGFSKKEAPVLAVHWIPAKHPACIHTCLLLNLVTLTVTVAGCYFHRQALALIAVSSTHFCAMFLQRKMQMDIWEIHHVCCWSCPLAKTSTTWLCQKVEVVSVEVEVSLWGEERPQWHTFSCQLPSPHKNDPRITFICIDWWGGGGGRTHSGFQRFSFEAISMPGGC